MALSTDTKNRLGYALTLTAAAAEVIAVLDNVAAFITSLLDLTVPRFLYESVTNGITAFATGGQATATALVLQRNRVTTCATAGDSVKLPPALAGLAIQVINDGAAALDIFPQTGETLNSLAANTAYRLGVKGMVTFFCAVNGAWRFAGAGQPAAKYTKNTTVGATAAAAGDLTGANTVTAEFSAVGAANLTTRTATQMFADMPNAQPGDSYELIIVNSSAGTTTVVAGAGVTLTGTATLATNTTRTFVVTFTSATALVMQSIGSSPI